MVLFDYLEWFLVSAVFEALPYFSSSNLVSYIRTMFFPIYIYYKKKNNNK